MSGVKSPNDVFSDSTIDILRTDDVPRLSWKLSSPETSDDETDVQLPGNDQSKQEHKCSSKFETNNTTASHKFMCSGLNNYQSTLEEHILDSAATSDSHDNSHTVENDTLMDTEITLSPTLLKESGFPDTWDNIIDAVLAEDRDFSQISTDIIPQIDNEILTLSTDEEQEEEQSSCQINKDSEKQWLPVEKAPLDAKLNLVQSLSKCNGQLEDLIENETDMMGERLSQTLIISPQASQNDLQKDSLAVSAQMQNQVSPKKTVKYIISQPKGRGKNMRKLLSSLNRCKQLKVRSQKKEDKKRTAVISPKNNQISYNRKYRLQNTSLPKNSGSGYMLRAAQQRCSETVENVFKESSQAENMISIKAGITNARNFGMKKHEKRRKSLQQRVRNRVSDLKEELFLWVSGKCQMTLARMRRILVEAKAAKEVCITLLSETKSAIKQKELQEIQRMCDLLVSQVSKAMQESTVNNSLLQYSSTSSSQTSFSTLGPSSSELCSPTSDEVEGHDVTTNKTSHALGNKISSNPHYQHNKSGKFSEMPCARMTVGKEMHMSSSDDEEIVKCSLQKSHATEPSFAHVTGSRKLGRIRSKKGTGSLCTASTSKHLVKNISTQTNVNEDSVHPMEDIEVSDADTFSRISTSIAVNGKKQHVTFEKNESHNIPTSKSVGTATSDISAVFDVKQSQTISEILQKVFPERKISLTKIIFDTSQENSTSWQPVIVENLCKDATERIDTVGDPHLPSSNTQELILLQKYEDSLSKNKTISVPDILDTSESEAILINNTKQKHSDAISPEDDCNKNNVETASEVSLESPTVTHSIESAADCIPALHSSVSFSSSCHLQNLQQKSVQILTSPAILGGIGQDREATDSQELSSEKCNEGTTKTSSKENNTLNKQPKRTENQKHLKKNKTGAFGNNYEAKSDKPDCLPPSCSHHNQLGDSGFDTQHPSCPVSCGISIPNNVCTLNSSVPHISETGKCLSQLPQTQNCQSQSQAESISILAIPDMTKKRSEATKDGTRVTETEKGAGNIFKIMPSPKSEKPKPPFYEVPPQTIFDIVTLCLPSRGEYIPNDQLPEGFWDNPDFPWLPEWIDDLDEWDE